MISLFIKQNNNNHQRMTVRDQRGQILYLIEGHWGRKNDIVSLYSLEGDFLLSVKQTKQTPLPVFEIRDSHEKIGTMRKHPGLFGIRDSYFTLHPHEWVVTGDFEELYYTVTKENHMIMECEKDLYHQYSVYKLIVDREENIPLCALISILFDPYSRVKGDDENNLAGSDFDLGFSSGLCFSYPSATTGLARKQSLQQTDKTR